VAQHGATSAVVLVGNSLGGLLTVRAAATVKGLPIRGIVAIDAAGTGWTPLVRAVIVQNLLILTPLVALPVPPMVRRAGVTLAARIVLYGRWRSADPETIDNFAKGIRTRRDAQRLIAVARRTVREVNALETFDGIDCATVVLHGRRDPLVSVDAARRLHRMIPGSRLVVLERSGHCPQLDAPERVAALAIELATAATAGRAGTA
jgi:pimeloyl-ACP methyl ester carboxylesterase